MKKFNLNNYVYFQPNEIGLRIYNDYYKDQFCKDGLHLKVDDKGFAKLQFHEFVRIYGIAINTSYIGSKKPFDNFEIFFNEDDLK